MSSNIVNPPPISSDLQTRGGEETVSGCSLCRPLNRPKNLRDLKTSSPQDLSTSARSCIICSLLWKIVTVFQPDAEKLPNPGTSFAWLPQEQIISFDFWTHASERDALIKNRRIRLFSSADQSYNLDGIRVFPARSLQGHTASPSVWNSIREWLAECSQSHTAPLCYGGESPTPLPNRVLDLGSPESSSQNLRLRETVTGEFARYICLSHCWGAAGCAIKTTTQNKDAHRDRILFEHLPQTFKDAVVFTRWLGVRFLWIDALCIVQDDESDWDRESGRMASIYENAYLTLSAAKAACDADGLFMYDERSASEYELIFEREPPLRPIRLFIREAIHHSPIDGEYKERQAHSSFPLLSRAWAFQERILSPRVLHFGGRELYWECRQTTHCECGHKGIAKSWAKREFTYLLRPPPTNRTPSFELDRLTRWKRLVEKYSDHHLTFPTDRLPAISGLAKKMQASLPGVRYLAGIWENDGAALIWRILGDPVPLPPAYVAPSWSWASLDRSIRYTRVGLRDSLYYRILDANCVPTGRDPTGRVSQGYLTVQGRLEKASVEKALHLYHWTFPSSSGFGCSSLLTWWDTTDDHEATTDLRLLLLAEIKSAMFFLIMKSVDEPNNGLGTKYRRLGILQMDQDLEGGMESELTNRSLFQVTQTFMLT